MVKADAYGHGAVECAKIMYSAGADMFAVATVNEGVELRQGGITKPILILSEPPIEAIPTLLEFDIMPSVYTSDFALAYGECAVAAGLKREDVYIANVLKCRPPGNRNPRPEEVLACSPFLREQIRSIWPDIIVTLGNPATHFVLKTEIGITKLRGRFHQMGHFVVMPTFHPAAALRNPAWQELLEEDFKMLGDYLERHPAPEDASE